MSRHYGDIAFTADVSAAQSRNGSRRFYGRKQARADTTALPDPLTEDERDFLGERDGFYLASLSETGWPYVQFRGGPAGFLRVLDEHTLGWADFRGNLQYISTGNLAGDDRVSIIAMDYAHRQRLKIFGHARVMSAEDDPALVEALADPSYEAVIERAVLISVDAFDWNCPQHITPRYSVAEIEPLVAPLRSALDAAQAENRELQRLLEDAL
jgi:predicted pyridoxine 5'-phosphate oxidase superfamily flavin-nucleotide-binding protein